MSRGDDDGSAVLLVGLVVAFAAAILVLVVDLGAYALAAARAQDAADAAARAAVAVADPRGRLGGDPVVVAHRVTEAAGGSVEACDCPAGGDQVRVEVSVEVRALVITRFGPRRIRAHAVARLRPG